MTGRVQLPSGVVEIHAELTIPAGAHDLDIAGGTGTVLRAADDFQGRAIIAGALGQRIRLHNFKIDGNRRAFSQPVETAPPKMPSA